MKNILILSLLALGALLLCGCQLFEANVKPNVSAVNVSLDGKTIDKVQSFAGEVKATITKLPTGQQEVKLKSTGFWDFLGGFGVWFLIGGLFLLAAIVAAFFFKAFSVAWSSGLSGAVVLGGVFFLKVFWVWIAWAVALLLIAGAAYELWRFRKKLLPKTKTPTAATAVPTPASK